ncbi:glycosyltransferase [Lactovum odontotermitis]
MSQTDLSIIITAHSEGILLHKTLLNVFRALRDLDNRLTNEIILHLDVPTKETEDYVKRQEKGLLKDVIIFRNKFKDLGVSRNFAISKAKGEIVAIIDGDDLYSENYFSLAIEELRKSEVPAIIHSKYIVNFERFDDIIETFGSDGSSLDILKFLSGNRWTSNIITYRKILLENPYIKSEGCLAFEDYLLNVELTDKGYKHLVVDTALFYRKKWTNSLNFSSLNNKSVIRKNSLFDFDKIKSLDISDMLKDREEIKESLQAPKRSNLGNALFEFGSTFQKVFPNIANIFPRKKKENHSTQSLCPDWLAEEFNKLHKIEVEIFMSEERFLSQEVVKYGIKYKAGLIYSKIIKECKNKPDTLFIVPWLIAGGGDKVFINYANEFVKRFDWSILFLQTEKKTSVWKNRLNPSISFVDFGDLVRGNLTLDESTDILAKFVVQNDIKRIIIGGGAGVGYRFIQEYANLLQQLGINVFNFGFCEVIESNGKRTGTVHNELPKIYSIVDKVITDNQIIANTLVSQYGYDKDLFTVHHQPVEFEVQKPIMNDRPKIKILWASRISKQKRPDILIEIAKRLDRNFFEIEAYGVLDDKSFQKVLENFKTVGVNFKGGFKGIDSIPCEKYDVFLHTSEYEGVPLTLLEVSAKGLPIVASGVGGIPEIIHDGTGCLIKDFLDIESYISALEKMRNYDFRYSCVKGAQKLLLEDFNFNQWEKKFCSDFQPYEK